MICDVRTLLTDRVVVASLYGVCGVRSQYDEFVAAPKADHFARAAHVVQCVRDSSPLLAKVNEENTHSAHTQ